jgi:transcriptional regulator with XRE-family HTH domain
LLATEIRFEAFCRMDEAELRLQLGERVKYFRRLSRLTQAQLAEKADLSVNYVSEIETGIASPTLKTLLKLAQVLNVEMEELFNFEKRGTSKKVEGRKREIE